LESAITDAVKKSGPDSEAFIDVFVEHLKPRTQFDANWAIRGVKLGRSDREKAAQAIAAIVTQMQREFRLLEDSAAAEATNRNRTG
jgi:polysaccharide pyruvyl transferase WcaK-like protein